MSDGGLHLATNHPGRHQEKRRLMVTQLLRAPVLNPAGTEVGRVEDFIVKLSDGAYPPITGLKVRAGAQDAFIAKDLIERLAPRAVPLTTHPPRPHASLRPP